MSKRSKRNKRRANRLVQDSASSGNGYNPRPGIDVPLNSAGAGLVPRMDEFTAEALYLRNSVAKNIVDMPAEDVTRNGWVIKMDDDKLANQLNERMHDLNAKEAITQMFKYQRMYGMGGVFIGVDTSKTVLPSEELDPRYLKKVSYLTPFSSKKVNELVFNSDITDENYGKVEEVKLKNDVINHTRFMIAIGLMLEDEDKGRSIYEGMQPELETVDTAINSTRKILSDYVFKVFKAEGAQDLSTDDKIAVAMAAQQQFTTDALAIIEKDESLENQEKRISGIKELLDYSWERVATASRMPKTIIMGQETGTLTGSQYDLKNYYARIKTIQENELRPHLENLVRFLLWAEDEPGGRVDPDKVNWSLEFNPLFEMDESTAADIDLKQAQTDKIYLEAGVVQPEEVHDARFSSLGMTSGTNVTKDADDVTEQGTKWFSNLFKRKGG